jgi:hypothetical protein
MGIGAIDCSSSMPGINHLLNEKYYTEMVPVSMKADLGPISNQQFHYSQLNTAAGINERLFKRSYCAIELFENINLNPEAGLSVSVFKRSEDFSFLINGYIATCVFGNRRKIVRSSGELSNAFAYTEYAPFLYGCQTRFGLKRTYIGIDYVRNSSAYDPRFIPKNDLWDYLIDRHFYRKNPQPENYLVNSFKCSGTVEISRAHMAVSMYFMPAVFPLKNRIGFEVGYFPKIE